MNVNLIFKSAKERNPFFFNSIDKAIKFCDKRYDINCISQQTGNNSWTILTRNGVIVGEVTQVEKL
jgi:hypothetical protein